MVTSLNLLCAAQADMEENSSYRQVKPKVEHSIDCRCKSFNDSSLSGGNVRYISLRKHGPWRSASDLTQLSQFFNDNGDRVYLTGAGNDSPPVITTEQPQGPIRRTKSYNELSRLFYSNINLENKDSIVGIVKRVPDLVTENEDSLTMSLKLFSTTKILSKHNSKLYLPAPENFSKDLPINSQENMIRKSRSYSLPEDLFYSGIIPKSEFLVSDYVKRPLSYQAIKDQEIRRCASEPIIEENAFNATDSIMYIPRGIDSGNGDNTMSPSIDDDVVDHSITF